MENVPEQNTDQTTPAAPTSEAGKTASYGPMLGIVLIVAVLVIGAFYVWGQRLSENQPVMVPEDGVRGGALDVDMNVNYAPPGEVSD